MQRVSLATKIGSTAEVRPGAPDVILASEPTLGSTLRTKGRLYLLCEVDGQRPAAGAEIAREVADLARQEYYYDLSAGIEVSLRKALRHANRRAAQRLRDQRGRVKLHCACAIVVNNELYASRIGAAQVFLVRRARLFLPGDEPGELADFVHRTTTREAPSLGALSDVLPDVWRQNVEAGDTVMLVSSALTDGLGAEVLKNAAVTLHPRAAAEHVHNRAVADGVRGSLAAIFIEISAGVGSVARAAPEPEPLEPSEVLIAETIRSRLEDLWRRRPKIIEAVGAAAAPVTEAVGKTVAVGFELMPRRAPPLPRRPDLARERSRRQQRAASVLALFLLVVAAAIGTVAYQDYTANRVRGDFQLALLSVESDLAAAQRFTERKPPEMDNARQRLERARATLATAARSPAAERSRVDAFAKQIATLEDRVDGVILDLSTVAADARPTALVATSKGLYAADPGAGRLWRIFGEPTEAKAVLERGAQGIGSPRLVTAQGDTLYSVDDAKHVWRAEGNTVVDVTPPQSEAWKSADAVAIFLGNLYVLDTSTGQVWKHESPDGTRFDRPQAYLADALPSGSARSLGVDADIWITNDQGDVLRFRRLTSSFTATRVDFRPRWSGDPIRATAVQALDAQRAIYLLDAAGRRVVQLSRDGGEIARFALPASLPAPTAFYVSEGLRTIYTVHGSKIVATELRA